MSVIKTVRDAGISAELYPDSVKMKKQMNYANAKQIPFVVLAGENEIQTQKITLKNMETGSQQMIDTNQLIELLSKQ